MPVIESEQVGAASSELSRGVARDNQQAESLSSANRQGMAKVTELSIRDCLTCRAHLAAMRTV